MPKSPQGAPQESLSEAHEKYQTLLEHLSVGVYRNTPGPKGHFLEANPAIVKMFEAKSKAEFMKHNVSDLYQNPAKRKEFVAEIMKKGEVKNKEIELVTLKGKKIIGSVTAVMKKTKSGEVYFDGVVEDVTEHKKMENELNRYSDDLEIQVQNRTRQLQELNKKLSSEIAQRKKTQKILQKSNDMLESTKRAMLNVMDDLGNAKAIIEKEKSKDDAMLASIGEGLIAVDNEGQVMMMNKVAEDMLGYTFKELTGLPLTNLILEDEAGNVLPLSKRPTTIALATGKMIKISHFYVKGDKIRFPIAITATPIKLDGKVIGLIEIIRDITREIEVDKAKSEFVSMASHQLRTPLGIMKWYLEALGNTEYFKAAPTEVRGYFEEMCRANDRVLSLVKDLLSVSRIEQGRVKNVPKLVNIAQEVGVIVEQMQIVAKQKKIKLHLDVDDNKPKLIKLDSLRFQEVIENLIGNAIEYTEELGSVKVRISQEATSIIISVEDTGIGISRLDQAKLFTKFFRSENAVAKNAEGSGLGLYVVKSYVEGWGGTITVKSNLAVGSTFTITLPIKKKEG